MRKPSLKCHKRPVVSAISFFKRSNHTVSKRKWKCTDSLEKCTDSFGDLWWQQGELLSISYYSYAWLITITFAINTDIFSKLNTLGFNCSIFHLLRWNISLKLALHQDKNKSLSHSTQKTDVTMPLSNKTNCCLFKAMSMMHSSIGE